MSAATYQKLSDGRRSLADSGIRFEHDRGQLSLPGVVVGIRHPHHQPAAGAPVDTVTRWIVVTRAAVLPMTLVSGLVAALLAIGEPGLDWAGSCWPSSASCWRTWPTT